MQILLAILLYLQMILPNHTYTKSYIDNLIRTNQVRIDEIKNDQPLMQYIEQEWFDDVPSIIVINDDQMR